ncbi:hypothetical protein ACFQ3R_05645 [Mesonia ostreae]|uniref:DNA primase n=1 Tax=Mesonia ostreae TaxID=861110 RepID=A0ABU2KJU2_9FLAO|nr:hypothetical protein [Mesonia ostreae]MDT0294993.1 hypothetical protein [Mesonia ostreae]
MKRVIVDYKKLTPEILGLLVEKYPDGYDDDHIITFKNAKNETIEAVEVKTEDSIYLVKVSTRLENTMANYEEDDYEDEDLNEPIEEINANDKKLLQEDLDIDAEDDDDEENDKEEE